MILAVLPGVLEERARDFCPVRALIKEDFPTLERPRKAISFPIIGGKALGVKAERRKCQSPWNFCLLVLVTRN